MADMGRIYVTLDTEMDKDEHWGKHFPPRFTSLTDGIPQYLRPIWDRCNVHPIYYVSPEVLYNDESVDILKNEITRGAMIGAHLHPEYVEPYKIWGKEIENKKSQFPCSEYSYEIEKEKLINLTQLINEKLGVTPIWYRAARFGADIDTIKILNELGYQYDSSVTPHIDWSRKGGQNHSNAQQGSYKISKNGLYLTAKEDDFSGIIEKPVTIFGKRWGLIGKLLPENWLFYRWLRPTHMTYLELKGVINKMVKSDMDEGVMMMHTMEIMINKTPYVRNKWMQKYYLWRLEKSLIYAKRQGYEL